MTSDVSASVDLWDVLEEAEMTVECWPLWQQRVQADVFCEQELPAWDLWEPSWFL